MYVSLFTETFRNIPIIQQGSFQEYVDIEWVSYSLNLNLLTWINQLGGTTSRQGRRQTESRESRGIRGYSCVREQKAMSVYWGRSKAEKTKQAELAMGKQSEGKR